jgi:hypothetical protein
MKWIKLFNKIGKQSLNIMQKEDVKLKLLNGDYYLLKLVFSDNGSRFHLELDKKIKEKTCNCSDRKSKYNFYHKSEENYKGYTPMSEIKSGKGLRPFL